MLNRKLYFKLGFLVILLTYSAISYSQTIKKIDFVANDIIYAPQHNSLYATAPSTNKSFGNSVCSINPITGKVTQSVYIGTEPTYLAVSDDGQFLYVGLEYLPRIVRLKLPEMKIDLTIQTTDTSSIYRGVVYAEDIKVLPGKPNSIAVIQGHYSSPSFSNVAIYDNDIQRPVLGYDRIYLSEVTTMTFLGNDPNTLVGGTNYNTYLIPVTNQGIGTPTDNYRDKLLGYDKYLKYSKRDSLLYTGTRILNPRSNPPLDIVHTFNFTDSPFSGFNPQVIVEPDPLADALYMSYLTGGKLLIKRYSTKTRLLTKEWTLLNNTEDRPKQIVSLGKAEKMALLSSNNIFLVDNDCVSTLSTIPTINEGYAINLCSDSSVTLTVNGSNKILWSTGDTTASLKIKTAGKYSVAFLDEQGCAGPPSASTLVTLTASPNSPYIYPVDPNISFNKEIVMCPGEKILMRVGFTEGASIKWNTGETTPIIAITQAGQYQVVLTNSAGCQKRSEPISVKYRTGQAPPKPVIKVVGKTDLCSPTEEVTLQAPAGYNTYNWSNYATTESITISPFSIDSFAVRVINTEGCTSEWSNFIKIRKLSTPPKPLLINKDSVLQSTNTAFYNHRWFFNGELIPNISAINFKPISGGFYTVQAYNGQCESPFSDWINVISTIKTSIESLSEIGFIQVYPNPTENVIRVQIISDLKGGTIDLCDNIGKVIKTEKIDASSNQMEISLSALQSGTYMLVWKSKEGKLRGYKKITKI